LGQQPPRDKPSPVPRDTFQLPEITVIGTTDDLTRIPGSGAIVDRRTLARARTLTINEIVREVPGLHARDEEGLGLRPNIGIRGLNPTRSSRVLLLEDGLPLTIAPYGANESYYHPPLDRFDHIEILKGSGQIQFGPQTIGGVINYVTPPVPVRRSGELTLAAGNRGYRDARIRYGGMLGPAGASLSYARRRTDLSRENTGTRLDDANLKTILAAGGGHTLTLRANYYRERSNLTYSGLTEAEYAADPRQNPFRNDSMLMDRWGASLTHRWALNAAVSVTTSAYGYYISRDWWRQSSFSDQRPNDASDPGCVGLENLNTTCGNQGRMRGYRVWGIEPRLHAEHVVLGIPAATEAGLRAHYERQERRQWNGATPNAREPGPSDNVNSGVIEENERNNQAYSAFLQERFRLGAWTLSPGLRLEHVRYQRTNRLNGASGRTDLTQLIPGAGVTYAAGRRLTLFAGAHRGFAPPRTEDLIDNATGGVVDLDPELSWNYELGVRAAPSEQVSLEATAFRLDFENQIIPASLAGGAGATLTSAGRTRHGGLELAGRISTGSAAPHRLALRAAWTWVPLARFEGERYGYVGTGGSDVPGKVYTSQNSSGTRRQVSVSGNRLPYAPRGTLTVAAEYSHRARLDARVEMSRLGEQFADALNSSATIPDGQQGVIPAATVWNASAGYRIAPTRTAVFVAVKNLFDATYIVDRTRGILPGIPRVIQAGVEQAL
jgi:Fe(3+) dicitrate transport protein